MPSLKPCPDKPNCVSSKADDEHAIAPFKLKQNQPVDQQRLLEVLNQLDNNIAVIHDENHIHAEITSRVFGFVDDLDLIINIEQQIIHVRSASRTGYYDFGVNRRRVERLRSLLKQHGIIL
ncbi:MAG: hypothetical protein ACJA2Y_000387 [Cycloclasticus pugetii]|jgi:uncharacterized protein (DUF1499 family)|nr:MULTISPECIES: DUF1499 domain-containing protein [Cycloclasticus]AFT68159.1 hypothetical protein Q91_2126 [Cycloclasticus sp. P1]ATI04137.1 DUF1499 domain-containing protein [Cycloclasticus sp. PY97N]MBV1898198.1 DUF1499 domain-containing protein [Cycloclasticus sp.]MDF1830130.1 DUF1499 domain-containing protein [Cycloclasticus pugetii]PHR51058.1 MAG: DUF1499 domain-containing protein [Cycloclasticus sp.]